MEFIRNLLEGYPHLWGGGVAHSVLILSLVITFGIMLGKIKVAGISLGMTWILFVGILFGHFQLTLNENLLHFMKEFGLILFVYSIGLQVGPGFFSAFKKGGATLNLLAAGSVLVSVVLAIALHFATGTPITTMTGILSGAVTNTPGLGAAQQANSDLSGMDAPEIAMGYAVAYPLGVVGAILALLALKKILRINGAKEEIDAEKGLGNNQDLTIRPLTLVVKNGAVDGKSIREIRPLVNRNFVISRILPHGENRQVALVNSETVLHLGDRLLIISQPTDIEAITVFFGEQTEMEWEQLNKNLISRRILITKPELNGKMLSQLKIRSNFGASITRINRSGVDLVASPQLQIQMGDRVTIVGSELAVSHAEKVLGNSLKRLNHPNLIPIFVGIALGCILGSIPFAFPGIPQPVKLGLAGGPLIVSILISRFGPKYKMITYTTMSANLMVREIGISLFLACVGLGAGEGFISTIAQGGYVWIAYGFLITVIPLLVMGVIGRFACKLNYFTLIGVLSGANTNPPALAYCNDLTSGDAPAVGYATVYPLAMFLRVLSAQLLILAFA